MEKIGYLGPEGSYSSLAAARLRPNAVLKDYQSFPLVFASLVNGETDGIAVPIENSLNGGVLQNMDLLQATDGVYAAAETTIKIDHRLAYLNGADLRGITRIYSHSQALAQCADFLYENFPSASLIHTPLTAASLSMVKTLSDACIVGAHTEKAGFALSPENIADADNNHTRFLLIKRGEAPENARSQRIYFSVTSLNKSGALLSLLQIVSDHGLNMTKIESRPVKTAAEEYRFFIEIEGDYSSQEVKDALAHVRNSAKSFKLLGAYSEQNEKTD